jgi:DNA-binding NtrC family response regulator
MGEILLIEDNEDFRELFKISLEQAGIKRALLQASDPIGGLDVFIKNRHKIQIVISDFYMPVQNGNDILEMIKSYEPSVTCCLLSGDDSVVRKNFPSVDKSFLKEDLAGCIAFIKNIDWKR